MSPAVAGRSNRLAAETSLYLRQHARNPVDWYPWGEEALSRARSEGKPIFLSIGYSSCHWCHVMERECFEDEAIARLLNESFVSIKVDREERPDLDHVYQNVAQLFTGGGGWPLSVFLLPDLRPFFGGTYFPPSDRYGRPGFPRLLNALSEAFRNGREEVLARASKIEEAIRAQETVSGSGLPAAEAPDPESLDRAAGLLLRAVDPERGGFQGAPKFPNATAFTFLWELGLATTDAALSGSCSEAVRRTLLGIADGGIHDQIGGGFHRYSVDAEWSVPHFEKMLYDQALLLRLYSEVSATGTPPERARFLEVIRSTLRYLEREMRTPEGLYASSQDADSEGGEGKYFVWTRPELDALLGARDAELAARAFGVSEEGNFEEGATVLFRTGAESAEERARLPGIARRMFEERRKRQAPATDPKALLAWNALLVSGFVWASLALEEEFPAEAEAADREAMRLFARMETLFVRDPGKGASLLWSVRDGGRGHAPAYLDDYAYFAAAALDLQCRPRGSAEADRMRARAGEALGAIRDRFADGESAAFSFTGTEHESLFVRPATLFDAALPSGNAIALQSMLALSGADAARMDFGEEARGRIASLFPEFAREPYGHAGIGLAALSCVKRTVCSDGVCREIPADPLVLTRVARRTP